MSRTAITLGLFVVAFLAVPAHSQDQGAATPAPSPASPAAHVTRIRIGGNVQAAKLAHQVTPVYPQIAKTAHVSGTVVLHGIISKDGSVQELEFVSGPPLLIKAAMDAVKQWQYQPTLLAGEPVEVDTTIQVVFTLSDAPPTESQEKGPQEKGPQEVDPQFNTDIVHLFDVMHLQERTVTIGRTIFASLRPAIMASLPPTPSREKIADAYQEKLVGLFSSQEFIDSSVAVYAKYLSDDDVKALADFYQTPAGQHFNAVSGELTSAGSAIGQDLARRHLPDILLSLCKEYPELKGEANFCPHDSPQNKGLLIAPDGAQPDASKAGD